MDPTFLIVIFVALFIVVAIFGYLAAAKRKKELLAWSAGHGLSFDEGRFRGFDVEYGAFECLREGSDRYAFNLMEGPWGSWRVLCFDYHYETESTDSKGNRSTTNHYFSGVLLRTAFPLEDLFIRPEGLFDKIKSFFGCEDINFESAEFSRKFFVKARDRKWAYDVIHARAMQLLLDHRPFTIQFAGNCVLVHDGRTYAPKDFDEALAVGAGLLDLLPEYVVKQQSEQPRV